MSIKKPFKKILFITSCTETWGGSEELWFNVSEKLMSKDFEIHVYKDIIDKNHFKFKTLLKKDVELHSFQTVAFGLYKVLYYIIAYLRFPLFNHLRWAYYARRVFRMKGLQKTMRQVKPDYVYISQGINYDGMDYAHLIEKLKVPYSIICQKVIETDFPSDEKTNTQIRKTFLNAHKIFFVSNHNKVITEEQIGAYLPQSVVILNPNKFQDLKDIPSTVFNPERVVFLCIGRFYIFDKGQDILIRILNKGKWRKRNIMVHLIGKGIDEHAIANRIKHYDLDNIEFREYNDNILDNWRDAQGLILPSRHEGLPLVLLEAMSLGKICIVGNAGGSNEIVDDGHNGFIGDPTTESFDAAMERAWQARNKWEAISLNAQVTITSQYNNNYPHDVVIQETIE